MPVVKLFSQRQREAAQGGQPDVYQYEVLPPAFRNQVIHIWASAIGPWTPTTPLYDETSASSDVWDTVSSTVSRELGLIRLGAPNSNSQAQCCDFIQKCPTDQALDIIEYSFSLMNSRMRKLSKFDKKMLSITQSPDDAVAELNERFKQHQIGYQFVGGTLVRIDSEFLHREVVAPALALLRGPEFMGANEEFLRAHEHYRHGRNREAVVEAGKAFESAMKAIIAARQWAMPSSANAQKLIATLFNESLVPAEMQTQFSTLRGLLESGAPTVRNQAGRGHGQGALPVDVPDHVAAYALHLAAANIVFLVELHQAMK